MYHRLLRGDRRSLRSGLVGGPFAAPSRVGFGARMVMLVTVSPRKPIYHELNDKNFFSVNLN